MHCWLRRLLKLFVVLLQITFEKKEKALQKTIDCTCGFVLHCNVMVFNVNSSGEKREQAAKEGAQGEINTEKKYLYVLNVHQIHTPGLGQSNSHLTSRLGQKQVPVLLVYIWHYKCFWNTRKTWIWLCKTEH